MVAAVPKVAMVVAATGQAVVAVGTRGLAAHSVEVVATAKAAAAAASVLSVLFP